MKVSTLLLSVSVLLCAFRLSWSATTNTPTPLPINSPTTPKTTVKPSPSTPKAPVKPLNSPTTPKTTVKPSPSTPKAPVKPLNSPTTPKTTVKPSPSTPKTTVKPLSTTLNPKTTPKTNQNPQTKPDIAATTLKPTIPSSTLPITTSATVSSAPAQPLIKAQSLNDCAFEKNCIDITQTIWASDGEICQPFQNECILFNFNCMRLYTHQKVMQQVTQEACRPLCQKSSQCKTILNTYVCGVYNGQYKLFPSSCHMDASNCENGETFNAADMENCENRSDFYLE